MSNCCELLIPGEEEEDDDIGGVAPLPEDCPEVSTLKKVEVEIQERRDTRPGVPHVREWDKGKGETLKVVKRCKILCTCKSCVCIGFDKKHHYC